MKTEVLKEWAEYRPLINRIRKEHGFGVLEERREKDPLLFRGVGSSEWPLETTLERVTKERLSVANYVEHAGCCANELASMFGQKWNIPTLPDLKEEIRAKQDYGRVHLPCYDYLVYLRHHGFPSPLLDWTASPYIAAYFAFFESPAANRCRVALELCEPVAAHAAVYAYIEMPKGPKISDDGEPKIYVKGPLVTTHRRHFAQKAWYTVATRFDLQKQEHSFCPHADVFDCAGENQDALIKIVLPATERKVALRELDDHNINHFTLFQTEDSFVKALAIREFELRGT